MALQVHKFRNRVKRRESGVYWRQIKPKGIPRL